MDKMSKEVLMSRRPNAMDTIDAARISHGDVYKSGGYQPPPISNYKGVMLCDRPTTKGGAGKTAQSDGGPFACAVGPGSKYEALGLNPSREQRAAKLAADNKVRPREGNDFLSKHKKWLSQLGKAKQQRMEDEAMAVQGAIEKTKKFKEYAAKLRANIREAKDQHATGYLSQEALEEHTRSSMSGASSKRSSQQGKPQKQKEAKKPVWALTEEGLEGREEEELDELLKFTNNLDYDKFIEDYEVKNALTAVKNRIAELAQGKDRIRRAEENGQNEEESALDLNDSGSEWKEAFVKGWNEAENPDRLNTARSDRTNVSRVSQATARSHRSAAEDDAQSVAASDVSDRDVSMQVAEQILNTSRSLRKVHSTRSIRGILDKKAKKIQTLETVGEDVDIGQGINPPISKVYDAEDQGVAAGGGNKKRTVDASNLPYLHRNPAV
mmetsp:Transcript_24932/g.82135  ORF Transcript_24932/g.82135 Transcript_24932/m.82135 type:complete len:439 (-) Transcript_24932:141-1457(-)